MWIRCLTLLAVMLLTIPSTLAFQQEEQEQQEQTEQEKQQQEQQEQEFELPTFEEVVVVTASKVEEKLINAPDAVVSEALVGMELAHPELSIDHELAIIYRGDAPVAGKVGVISGGGSGHEPMHGGFVGEGMLDAACAGAVFTSPTPSKASVRRSGSWSKKPVQAA